MARGYAEILSYKQLLYMLTWKEIKIRYKQSIMGFLWAILMPMLIVTSGVLIRKAFAVVSGGKLEFMDIASVSVKALPYSFFIASIRFATNSLTGNHNLVTKIYFPREVFPIAAVLSNLFDFAIASVALVAILAAAGVGVSRQLLWLPVLLLFLVCFSIAVGMILACGNLFFRDVKYIVEVLVTFAIFFTPVFYDASIFGKWAFVMLVNPVGALLESINAVVVRHAAPSLFWVAYAGVWSIGGMLLFWVVFKKLEYAFAENI